MFRSRTLPLLSALVACSFNTALADTVQLKDKAAITGKVVAEKRDQIAVDVGYTILLIPRNQILKITPEATAATKSKNQRTAPTSPGVSEPVRSTNPGFYSAPAKSGPVRTVLELVNQIGEAVVQVRTPGGLGSGFFLNEEEIGRAHV